MSWIDFTSTLLDDNVWLTTGSNSPAALLVIECLALSVRCWIDWIARPGSVATSKQYLGRTLGARQKSHCKALELSDIKWSLTVVNFVNASMWSQAIYQNSRAQPCKALGSTFLQLSSCIRRKALDVRGRQHVVEKLKGSIPTGRLVQGRTAMRWCLSESLQNMGQKRHSADHWPLWSCSLCNARGGTLCSWNLKKYSMPIFQKWQNSSCWMFATVRLVNHSPLQVSAASLTTDGEFCSQSLRLIHVAMWLLHDLYSQRLITCMIIT